MLKYLFIAFFADGSRLEQTPEDKPMWAMREDGSGSAFTDVLHPKSPLVEFVLAGDNREYGINLKTLNFTVAAGEHTSQFRLHSERDHLSNAKIHYFRNVTQNAHIGAQSGKILGTDSHTSYQVGYSATDALGNEVIKFIEFD